MANGISRDFVKGIFADATDEQITTLLNKYHADIETSKKKDEEAKAKQKEDTEKLKSVEEQKAELEKKLAELEDEKLSAEEKREKEFRALQEKNLELEQRLNTEQIKSYAASKNLVGENVDKILSAFGGNFEAAKGAIDSMTSLLDETGKAAALAKEQEIARMSSNPNGQNGETTIESLAEQKAKERAERRSTGVNNDVINMYRR